MDETHEKNQNLWMLTAAMSIWAAHFLICYATVSIWCAKAADSNDSLIRIQIPIAVITAIALVGTAIVGRYGYKRHRYGSETIPHDFDTPEDRHRFLGFAILLLSGLGAVAIIYTSLVFIFVRNCQ